MYLLVCFYSHCGSILNGPQGTQGGDLGLGQALDARDIEPLISPVATQCAHMLAALEVPELDRSIIAATGQPPPLGTHLEVLHCTLVSLLHPHTHYAELVP